MDGSIVKIYVRNFLTFYELTLAPNKLMNLITGPNGSGKSTLMCAMCLGLGGKPKVVGRASCVSDFIRYNAERAVIELELLNTKGLNYVVKREILKDNKSTWTLGGFSCSQKEVEALVSRLNIQIENLCQFLPQERVQDFAKMNGISLMENTEKCIGGIEMWENHLRLNTLGSMYLEKEKALNAKKEHLANEEKIFTSLQAVVNKMTFKRALVNKIESLKQKRALLIYEMSREDLVMSEDVLTKKMNARKALEKQRKPIEENLTKARHKLTAVEENLKRVTSTYTNINISSEPAFELPENINDECKENVSDFERFRTNERRRLEKLKDIRIQISYMENMLEQMEETVEDLNKNEAKHAAEEKDKIKVLFSIQRDKQSMEMKIMNIEHQLKLIDQEMAKANDVNALKLRTLKAKGLYDPIMWFRMNKDKLRGKAYEPMAMVINMKSTKMAKYLECVVPHRDLIAFVCEYAEDANFLMEELRDKMKYKINVITSKPTVEMSTFTRPYEISSLKMYGFHSFVSDIFTAPETIMRYLFKSYSIHKIPIGDSTTFLKAQEVPKDVRIFMTDDKKFTIRNSRYSHETISSSSQIREASLLTVSINEASVKECMSRSSKLKEEHLDLKNMFSCIESEENKHSDCLQNIKKIRSETKATLNKIGSTKSRLATLRRSEAEHLGKQCNEEEQRRRLENLNQKCTLRLISALNQNVGTLKKFGDIIMTMKLAQHKIHKARNDVAVIEHQLRAIIKSLNDAEKDERNSKEIYDEAKLQTQRHMKQFEELAKLKYNGKEFDALLKIFAAFPESLEEIDHEIHVTQTKAECLGHSDSNVVIEYERRQQTIAAFKKVIGQLTSDLEIAKNDIKLVQCKWLPFVNELVRRIDKTFGDLFAMINYVGEVNLVQGQNEYDFANYGLKIQVKFRQEGGLQELNQFRQSGGERAVAIAVYLMSMQELTSVPFRCVDEINQGMDEYHEAVIFKLLCDIVAKAGSAQYFIFTPKVLKTLKFSETIMYTCVINGELDNVHMNCNEIIRNKKADCAKRNEPQ